MALRPHTLCATTFEFSSVASETKALGEMVFTPYAMSSVSFCAAQDGMSRMDACAGYMLGDEGMHLQRQLDVVVRFIRAYNHVVVVRVAPVVRVFLEDQLRHVLALAVVARLLDEARGVEVLGEQLTRRAGTRVDDVLAHGLVCPGADRRTDAPRRETRTGRQPRTPKPVPLV